MLNRTIEKYLKIIIISLLFFSLERHPAGAAGAFDDAEKHLGNFELFFLKNDHKKAVEEFEKFTKTLPDSTSVPADNFYYEIRPVYSAFINYVSSFGSAGNAVSDEDGRFKAKNKLFLIFFKKYEALLKKQNEIIKAREIAPDPVSYFEELNKNEAKEKVVEPDHCASLSSEFEYSMKDASLIRFISGRPLFLFMLYKNLKETGSDFQVSFLKSIISKNIAGDILSLSGFPELAETGAPPSRSEWTVFDASLMTSFNCDKNKIPECIRRGTNGGGSVKKADLSKAEAVKIVFSKHSLGFDIKAPALARISNVFPDAVNIEIKNGRKIDIKIKKFDGVFSEAAFLKNCKKIKYNNIEFYSCPEVINKTFLLNTGKDLIEIVFINFPSDIEAQAVLNSFRAL